PVLPGPGHLLINGPTPDYVHVETSQRKLSAGEAGGLRFYPDGLVELDLKAGTRTHEVNVPLRRGITVKGAVVGPDGKPVQQGFLLARSSIPRGYSHQSHSPAFVLGGTFELPGCDPDKAQTVYLLDGKNQLGAKVELGGKKSGDRPVTVRLERCVSATA